MRVGEQGQAVERTPHCPGGGETVVTWSVVMSELERNRCIQEMLTRSNQQALVIGFIGRGGVSGNIQAEWTRCHLGKWEAVDTVALSLF